MTKKRFAEIFFFAIILSFMYYSYLYIEASTFEFDGQKYYVLFDDAMVSMRYAWNLAHGNGLVWNVGEYVEGITNPAWTAFMALFHLLPVPLSHTSLFVQVSGAIFLTLNLFVVKQIVAEFTSNALVILATVLITASYAPLMIWGLLGMEVSVLVLILNIVVLKIIKADQQKFSPAPYIILGLASLIRIDIIVPYLAILIVMFFVQPQFRKQHLLWAGILLIFFIGGQSIARYLYFGEWLPNTYYLKLEGFPFTLRILRGLYTLFTFIWYSNWVLALLPLSIFIFKRDWKITLLWLIFLAQVAYSAYVGGDAWEHKGGANRFIATTMPLFFVLFTVTLDEFRKLIIEKVQAKTSRAEMVSNAVMFLLILFSIGNFNALLSDWDNIERWALQRRASYIRGNEQNLEYAVEIQKITKPGASIAVIGAGTTPYFLPDRYGIDLLGKADPVIAHSPIRTPMSIVDIPDMRPGHMKWDYDYSIGELKPDLIIILWEGTSEEFAPYKDEYLRGGTETVPWFWLRKDSPDILWENVVTP